MGAGRTTAIRILFDLIRPSGGLARVLGLDCQRDGVQARRNLGTWPEVSFRGPVPSGAFAITLTFAHLAMFFGAVAPDRRVATGVVTAVAVLGFFVDYLAALVDVLAPVAWLSPFYCYDPAVISGEVEFWKPALQLALCGLAALGTVVAFRRRDIGVRDLNLPLRPLRARDFG